MKTRYAKWRVSITLMTAQLVAGYLRGKPRSRSMHAATIKEHIKCTGYCRRDPYRQLLVSCCQPRRWTSRTYSPILGVPLQTDFPNWKLARYNILILFNSPLIRRILHLWITSKILTPEWILYRAISNRDFNFWGTTQQNICCPYSFYNFQKC